MQREDVRMQQVATLPVLCAIDDLVDSTARATTDADGLDNGKSDCACTLDYACTALAGSLC